MTLQDAHLTLPYREGGPYRVQVLHGLMGHNCYHANEIISIRHMLGLWLEENWEA